MLQGNNGSFRAMKGWDACTGVGSPNCTAVAALLLNMASSRTA
jgi:kumamolisin